MFRTSSFILLLVLLKIPATIENDSLACISASVKSPTLLIVGGDDHTVIMLNRKAFAELGGIKKMEIVEGASHLFEESGKLEEVAELSAQWFNTYLK